MQLSALFQYVAKDFMKNGLRAVFVLSGFCAFCPAFRRKLLGNCEKIRDSAQ
ncbi:FIG00637934: hypothetical protein [Escherichia coli ISC7]|uniref:Uncharacterized protein n=1 Tax=Escherichia coli ISC7 TaxID=1432555 RepID=W1F4J9_ECOLX|nr:FIG00637934: hypothetical protein [Escherichia coli ISC7]